MRPILSARSPLRPRLRSIALLGGIGLSMACAGDKASPEDEGGDDGSEAGDACPAYDPSPPLPGCLVSGTEDEQSDGRLLTRSRRLYNEAGQLSSFDERSGEDTSDWVLCGYTWEELGRPETEWCVGRALYTYTWLYDSQGEPTGKSYDAGSEGTLDKQWFYETDGQGHIIREAEDADLDGQGDSTMTRTWEGDEDISEDWDYDDNGVSDFIRSWTWEQGHRVSEETDTDADGIIDESITWTWDDVGNLVAEDEDTDGDGQNDLHTTWTYTVCLLEMVESVDEDQNTTRWTWLHDEQGRPIEERTDWDLDGNADQLSIWAYSCPGEAL